MKRSLRLLIILSPVLVAAIVEPIWGLVYVMFLGLSGLGKVFYSALNFNDCQEDAKLLTKEIVDAKQDLSKRGFKFTSQ